MRTHNIYTLTNEIYDKLANNTSYDQFNCDEYGLNEFYVDAEAGEIVVEYQDKKFIVKINEA